MERLRAVSDEQDKIDEKLICDLDEEIAELRAQIRTQQFQLIHNSQAISKTAYQGI